VKILVFYTLEDSTRLSRQFNRRPKEFVSDELRGWRWSEPPLISDSNIRLSVSDVAGGMCGTGRDTYIKLSTHVKPGDNALMQRGAIVHLTYEAAIRTAKRLMYGGVIKGSDFIDAMRMEGEKIHGELIKGKQWELDEEFIDVVFWSLWDQATSTYSGALDKARTVSRYASLESIINSVIPISVEFMIDGSLIGLTRGIRIDGVLFPYIPIEIKTGPPNEWHRTALAGYALAMESQWETPIDFGVLIYVDPHGDDIYLHENIVPISDQLRLDFIHERDRRIKIIEDGIDPGMPDKCNTWCPYLFHCDAKKDTGSGRVGINLKAKKGSNNTVGDGGGGG